MRNQVAVPAPSSGGLPPMVRRRAPSEGWSPAALWLTLCLAAILAIPGCGGCSQDPIDVSEAAKEKAKEELKKKEKPKPDFEPVKLRIVPQKTDEADIPRRLVKPGHWTAAVEEMKANNFDFNGQLYAEPRAAAADKPMELERTPHRLAITRSAPLAKGQPKFFETLFFIPPAQRKAWLASELRSRGGGVAATPGPEPLVIMKPYQYHLVVLAGEADRYRRL